MFRRFRTAPAADRPEFDLGRLVLPLVRMYELDLLHLETVLRELRDVVVRAADLDVVEEAKLPRRSELIVDLEAQIRERRRGLDLVGQLAEILDSPGPDAIERLAALAPQLEACFGEKEPS